MNLMPSAFLSTPQNRRNVKKVWYGLRIGWRVFIKRSVLSHASICGYSTILALIPILIISVSILEVFSGPDKEQIFDFVIEYFLPGAADDLNHTDAPNFDENGEAVSVNEKPISHAWFDAKKQIIDMIQGAASLRIISAVFLIAACVGLFNSIEFAFNDIWMVRKRRSLFKQFLAFWLLLTMTPILLGLSAYFTIQIQTTYAVMEDIYLYRKMLNNLISFIFTFLAFLFANRYLPNIPVHLYPSVMGSFFSAFMWETAKHAFGYYMSYSLSIENGYYTIYQSMVLIPVFIVWLYYSYLCFLLGPIIATTIQDYDQHLARLHRKRDRKDHLPLYTFRVFYLICSYFHFQKTGMPFEEVEKNTGWNVLRLRSCLNELIRIELIHVDQKKRLYFPNADPSSLTLRESLQSIIGLRHPNMDQIKKEENWINDVEEYVLKNPDIAILDIIRKDENNKVFANDDILLNPSPESKREREAVSIM